MNSKSKYDLLFDRSLEKLNENQRRAVDTIEGPVLVNAGPGTGKTQILATRIGKILRETDVFPHNILCLTFTDAATIAMRNRLVSIIGPTAHQIHIFTFHAFCNQVIQENMDIFGGYRQLEPVSDLETVEIYHKLIDDLPNDNILKRYKGDRYYEKKRMENLFRLMKKENITTERFHTIIKAYLEEQKGSDKYIAKRKASTKDKTYIKGDFRDDWFEKDKRKLDTLIAAVDQFDNFEKLMLEKERYDYDDMILWVLKAFQENEYLLMQYQERYQYFLVDEYQDTNGAQNNILEQLISYWDSPNVFVVGDDDQAIFKFQGANLKNLIEFRDKYQPEVIILDENYRSNQHILDVSMQLIEFNKERLVKNDPNLNKLIKASGEYKSDPTLPRIMAFEKQSAELAYIAHQLDTISQSNPELLSDTAILYRNHKQVEELITILEKKQIPYNVKRKINALSVPFVKNLINILKYIGEEFDKPYSANARLYDLMHYPYFEVNTHDIAKIIYTISHKRDTLKSKELRDIIADRETLDRIGLKDADKILELSAKLESWIGDIPNKTIQILFQDMLNEGGILQYTINQNEKAWFLQLLSSVFDFIKNETAKNPDIKLRVLMDMIDQMNDNNIELYVHKNISSEDGINFVTAHSAKGLEFKNVYVLGCTKNVWDKKQSNRSSYTYPDNVNSSSEVDIEDERRLFYVAMTRAKTDLVISYSEKNEEGKDLGASQFIDEILESELIQLQRPEVKESQLIDFYFSILEKKKRQIELIEKNLIDEWLTDYELSVTHLNKYLRCPLSFYFEIILRVPQARNASTGFGTAMHDALRKFFERYQDNGEKSKDNLLLYFDDSMNKHKSHFTEKEYESYHTLGRQTLDKVYDDRMERWLTVPKFAIEEKISHTEVKGIPIKGFLDKVEIFKDHVNVVDYKTGNPVNGFKKTKRPDDKNPDGGDYWRQLVFYKLLLLSDKKHNWNMETAEIDFLEPDRKTGEFSSWKYVVSPEDTEFVANQIQEVHKKILNYEFDTGCGESDCSWCTFVEKNELITNS